MHFNFIKDACQASFKTFYIIDLPDENKQIALLIKFWEVFN